MKQKQALRQEPKSLTNLNELALRVAEYEGGKKNLSIAQIKEVIACIGAVFAWDMSSEEVLQTVSRMIKRGTK